MADITPAAVSAIPPTSPTGARDPFAANIIYEILPIRDVFVAGATYVNRVLDSLAGGAGPTAFVRWTTEGAADPTGASYPPGNGTFGVTTSDYCVESIL